MKTDGGKGLKIVKRFKVNKELLTKDLEARSILEARSDLAETVGNPFIMVLPSVKKGQSPIDALRTNPAYKHAAAVGHRHAPTFAWCGVGSGGRSSVATC